MDTVLQWLSSALALLPAGLIAGVGIGAGAEAVKWLKESSLRRREQHDAGAAVALELVPLLTKFARECNSLWCYNEYEPTCRTAGLPGQLDVDVTAAKDSRSDPRAAERNRSR